MKPKITIIAAANNFHFIKDIANKLSEWFDVEMFQLTTSCHAELTCKIHSADIIWLEWADGININLFKANLFTNKKVILRLHRYELFTPRTLALIQQLTDSGDYKKIDKLVFVSEFVRQIGIDKFPWMEEISIVIPNLIDHTKYEFKQREPGYNLLFLGRTSYVKNMPLLLTFFDELYQVDRNWKLHIVGDVTEKELVYYKDSFIQKTQLQDNIKFYGKLAHEDVIRLMDDMHYIVCTSIFEAHPVGILEGMCRGLKPVIFSFPGAEQIYPAEYLFIDTTGFLERIIYENEYDPQKYHDFVVKNYSIKENIGLYKTLIEETVDANATI